jgi:hypothetical protein
VHAECGTLNTLLEAAEQKANPAFLQLVDVMRAEDVAVTQFTIAQARRK